MTAPIIKICSCCGKSYTRAAWKKLPLVAANYDVVGDGVEVLELRNCSCNSTISIVVTKKNPVQYFETYVIDVANLLTDRYDLHPDDAVEIIEEYQDAVIGWQERGVTVEDAAKTLYVYFEELLTKYA